MSEPTPLPQHVNIEDVRLLLERRKAGKMTGVWLSIESVEALLTEAELYRLKHDANYRRQRDAAKAMRATRERQQPLAPDD